MSSWDRLRFLSFLSFFGAFSGSAFGIFAGSALGVFAGSTF